MVTPAFYGTLLPVHLYHTMLFVSWTDSTWLAQLAILSAKFQLDGAL
jgi:hypothetical protein